MRIPLSLLASLLAFPAVAAPPAPVKLNVTESAFDFTVGDELVARYHKGSDVAKPYFWPLNAPGGFPVTRGWPMETGLPKETKDHVHQKSAWFCHGDVIPEGIELKQKVKGVKGIDFWSETANHGKIGCVSVGEPTAERSTAWVTTKNEWRTADGIKILDEDRKIMVNDLGDARLVVLDIDLHASVCPITFGDTKEGSMGVRVNDEIKATGGNGSYVNADGKRNEREVWGR